MRRLALLLSLPTLLVAAEPSVREMSLKTPDDHVLSGTLSVPEGRGKHPAVILVHPLRSDRKDWAPLIEKLNTRGLATLALDLRGHGQSSQLAASSTSMPASETVALDQIPSDLALVASWLRKQQGIDGRHLGLAGSGEGAFASLLASNMVKPTVMLALSPSGAEAFGQGARDRMIAAASRAHAALMAYVSMEDKEGEENLAPLRPVYGTDIRTFEGEQRGIEYLAQHSDVIAVFFAEYLLHPHSGRMAEKARPAAAGTPGAVLTPAAPTAP
jgi:dienelactone hydrolase